MFPMPYRTLQLKRISRGAEPRRTTAAAADDGARETHQPRGRRKRKEVSAVRDCRLPVAHER